MKVLKSKKAALIQGLIDSRLQIDSCIKVTFNVSREISYEDNWFTLSKGEDGRINSSGMALLGTPHEASPFVLQEAMGSAQADGAPFIAYLDIGEFCLYAIPTETLIQTVSDSPGKADHWIDSEVKAFKIDLSHLNEPEEHVDEITKGQVSVFLENGNA